MIPPSFPSRENWSRVRDGVGIDVSEEFAVIRLIARLVFAVTAVLKF